MSSADWRALLEAYLNGRLSAEAFMRRFVDAWRAGGAQPRAIALLQPTVEAFEAQVLEAEEDGAVNDDELRQAVQRAIANLSEETPISGAQTFDRTRAREEARRMQIQISGCAGIGCVIAIVWVALCVLQITFVSEYVQHELEMSAWPSAFIGFFLAFTPIVGNILAFIDATEIRHWPTWAAAVVFFAAPAATMISGWMRWRRFRR